MHELMEGEGDTQRISLSLLGQGMGEVGVAGRQGYRPREQERPDDLLALLLMGQVKPRQERSYYKEAELGGNAPAFPRASEGWTTGLWGPFWS